MHLSRARMGGFTLVEVLVALVITAVAVLGLASGTLATIRANRFSNRESLAAALTQKRLAELAEAAALGSVAALPPAGSRVEGEFTVSWDYPALPTLPAGVDPARLRVARVTASWNGLQPQIVSARTFLTD